VGQDEKGVSSKNGSCVLGQGAEKKVNCSPKVDISRSKDEYYLRKKGERAAKEETRDGGKGEGCDKSRSLGGKNQ